jgi:hypothetical protein
MSRRKAEMILELVDRATRPARRFIAMQQRMGRVVELANRISQRSARAAQRATDLYKRSVQGLGRAQDALQRGLRRSNDLIRRQITQMRTATGLMRDGVVGVGGAVAMAGGMVSAYTGTVAAAGLAMLGPARQFEKFQSTLTTTEGSAAAAKDAMKWVENFAVTTPYELDQVMDAFVQLRAYGLDPTNGLLMRLGDTSAAMGKPLMQSVEAIADAVNGENERLKEFGITASKARGMITYQYTDQKGVTRYAEAAADDKAAIQATLMEIMSKFDGSMVNMSKTFDGMVSNVLDIWSKFQRAIMASGVFDWMKGKLSLLLETLNIWEEDGRLQAYAEAIGTHIISAFEALWRFGVGAVEFMQDFYRVAGRAADALGGWRNLAIAVLAVPFRGVIIGAALALLKFAGGATLAMRALAGIGWGSAAAGALGIGRALMMLVNPLNWVKSAFIALRVAFISTGIGALVVGLAMAGLWIYNNWSGLVAFFKGFGEAFMDALGPARPLAEGVIKVFRRLWGWVANLIGPLDASAEKWAQWGRAAGRFVGEAVAAVGRFVRRIAEWFGRLKSIDWKSVLSLATLRTAWKTVSTWVSEKFKAIWTGLKAIEWSKFLSLETLKSAWESVKSWIAGVAATLWDTFSPLAWVGLVSSDDLSSAWTGVTNFVSEKAPVLWSKITAIGWFDKVNLATAQTAWDAVSTWIGGVLTTIWDALPRIKWAEFINLEGIKKAWSAVTDWFSEAAGKIWDLMPEMPEWKFSLWGDDQIDDPKTLLAAAEAAERLTKQFPEIDQAAQATLANLQAAITASATLLAGTSFASEGERLIQSLADGIRAKVSEVTAATKEITRAIRTALPRSATMRIGVQGGAAVQERARGGSFAPGWLLTGENGPELEYRTRGGFIAHNQALQNMVAMSETVARNSANANRAPGWLKGAALASGIAAGASMPAAALEQGHALTSEASTPIGAKYLTERNTPRAPGGRQVSVNMTFNGTVDRQVLPDLQAMKEEMLEAIFDRLDADERAGQRREQG